MGTSIDSSWVTCGQVEPLTRSDWMWLRRVSHEWPADAAAVRSLVA
jgi:hypothetical protein